MTSERYFYRIVPKRDVTVFGSCAAMPDDGELVC